MNYTGFNVGSVCEFYLIPLTSVLSFTQTSATNASVSIDPNFEFDPFAFSKDTAEPIIEYKDNKYGFVPGCDFTFSVAKFSETTLQKIKSYIGIPIIIYVKLLNQEVFVLGSPDFPLLIESVKSVIPPKTGQATFLNVNFAGSGSEFLSAQIT